MIKLSGVVVHHMLSMLGRTSLRTNAAVRMLSCVRCFLGSLIIRMLVLEQVLDLTLTRRGLVNLKTWPSQFNVISRQVSDVLVANFAWAPTWMASSRFTAKFWQLLLMRL